MRVATADAFHKSAALVKFADAVKTRMESAYLQYCGVNPCPRADLRAIASFVAASALRMRRKRAFLTVENFSQAAVFCPNKVACTTEIERIGKEVIRADRRSATKVASEF